MKSTLIWLAAAAGSSFSLIAMNQPFVIVLSLTMLSSAATWFVYIVARHYARRMLRPHLDTGMIRSGECPVCHCDALTEVTSTDAFKQYDCQNCYQMFEVSIKDGEFVTKRLGRRHQSEV